jgi:hypothetical protein
MFECCYRVSMDWPRMLDEQLSWWWDGALRPRMNGLTDSEYFWEPAPGAWGIRPKGTSTAPVSAGTGPYRVDFAFPEPDPPPVTTIGWRLAHVIVGVFGMRAASYFDGPACDYSTFAYAGSAAEALTQLDAAQAAWRAGVRALSDADLARPVGAAEGPWAKHPMAELVLHINREALHHGAEICLLRDLYRATRT